MDFKAEEIELPVNYHDTHYTKRRLVREEYVRRQGGRCCYCDCPLSEDPSNEVMAKTVTPDLYPPNFFKYPVHLHHSHETGLTIGAVHARCNAVLWEYEGE